MHFWRICRRRFAAEAASGEGARLYGGRWNSPGLRVVYAATSLALAAVETFVNLEPNLQPDDLVSIQGEIPEGLKIERLNPKRLPKAWREARAISLRKFGDQWITANKSMGLLVPSAVIAGEWNLLLNPIHKEFAKVKLGKSVLFKFDARMFR